MNSWNLCITLEPKGQYEKTKKDLLYAYISFRKLTPQQQLHLVDELFRATNTAKISDLNNNSYKGDMHGF